MYQRCLWLAGYKVTDEVGQEYGRIGQLDDKGWIRSNTWGGERDCGYFDDPEGYLSFIQDVTEGWIPCTDEDLIPLIAGMGPIQAGDMVLYRIDGQIKHMGLVSVPGTTQNDTWVDNAVWGAGRYRDPTTGTFYYRRAARIRIGILVDGQFRIRRLIETR